MSKIATVTAPTKSAHPLPATVELRQYRWQYLVGVVSYHLIALLAFVPAFFSWSGVIATCVGVYIFGTLGINLCYHRLLTHRGFRCSSTLEHFFALLGVCCVQDTPAHWVAIHRIHHQHSDEQPDPHTPLVNFFWGHIGWLMVENRDLDRRTMFERYVKDLLRDPFYLRLERNLFWVWINVAHWVVFFALGAAIGWFTSHNVQSTLLTGASVLLWGVFVRTVLVWHITWSVNSLSHMWGYQNYETGDDSRNNFFVGIVSNGEGWHNNHHAQPRAAAHGHRWWEFDVTYITIRMLQAVGLVWDVVLPNLEQASTTSPHTNPTSNTNADCPKV